MHRLSDITLTALAPLIWGSTYIVTVTYLPGLDPLLVSLLRALPAGLLLLLVTRQLPTGIWWPRVFLLGALNFSFFWWMLFIAAYSLPGGVAATVGAIQPLVVVFLARAFVGTPIMSVSIAAAVGGALGVGLLILKPSAELDATGILAGLLGALSMALGTVLTRRWQPPVPLLTFTAWQLTAGGILLLPALVGNLQTLVGFTSDNLIGIAYLSLIGAALTYIVWFRGIARLNPNLVAQLGFLSPVTAVALGWLFKDETLSLPQWLGIALIFASILLGQRGLRRGR